MIVINQHDPFAFAIVFNDRERALARLADLDIEEGADIGVCARCGVMLFSAYFEARGGRARTAKELETRVVRDCCPGSCALCPLNAQSQNIGTWIGYHLRVLHEEREP